jgi:hypothetical protein
MSKSWWSVLLLSNSLVAFCKNAFPRLLVICIHHVAFRSMLCIRRGFSNSCSSVVCNWITHSLWVDHRAQKTFNCCCHMLSIPCICMTCSSVSRRNTAVNESCRLTHVSNIVAGTRYILFGLYLTGCGARGSVVGWGSMLQGGRSPVRIPDEVDIFNLPNPCSRTMARGSTQPLTKMSIRNLPGGKKRPARRADNLVIICEPNVLKCGSLDLS